MKKMLMFLALLSIPARLPALDTNDILSLVGLPLAVAAVSEVTGVPQDQLADLVATLNNANVPATQEIQMIRYVPAALVTDDGQPFVDFVHQEVTQGVTGPALVPVIVEKLQTYYPPPQQIVVTTTPAPQPQPVIVERDFIPRAVVTRVEEVRLHAHPHGGPPGQLKKQLGLQTGAEVVHGRMPGPMISSAPVEVEREHGHGHGRELEEHGHGRGHVENAPPAVVQQPPMVMQPAPMTIPQGNPGRGHGEGVEEHGHGKGHGKDH